MIYLIVPDTRVVCCLGPEGNGVSSREGGEGGPGPPNKEGDKLSTLSEEGGNMEQEEEGRKSQAWRRGTSMHRLSIFKRLFSSVFKCSLMMLRLMLCLFQENKSYGIKTICIHPLMSRYCTSLRHVWQTNYKYFIMYNLSYINFTIFFRSLESIRAVRRQRA
jgi:hypothetical protein